MAAKSDSTRAYYEGFRARLVTVRTALNWSQAEMADALGIPLSNYKKYEIRSKFPLHLLDRLSLVTHREVEFWVTGRNVRALPRRSATAIVA